MNPYRWVNPSCSGSGMPPPPQYGHRFNPNAAAFVPRGGGGFPQSNMPNQGNMSNYGGHGGHVPQNQHQNQRHNQFDHFAPPYANAPMYGQNREMPQQYYPAEYAPPQPPTMTSFYSDDGGNMGYDQFGYGLQQPQCDFAPSADAQEKLRKCKNPFAVHEVLVGMEQLLQGGEDFHSWAGCIRTRLSSNMPDDCKKLVVQLACEMAIEVSPSPFADHKPQYTFGRLLAFIAADLPGFTANAILPTLEYFHGLNGQLTGDKKKNLIMFFAEVFSRLESDVCGQKILPLADALLQLINDSMKTPTDESMKLLIQVLKLAGPDLDSCKYKEMNDLLTRLNGYACGHPKLSESIKAQILDVIEQRTKGWGGRGYGQSGEFFLSDGTSYTLNEEEQRFIDKHINNGESTSRETTGNDPSDTSLDEADVLNEFDSFMKEEDEKMQEKMMAMVNGLNLDEGLKSPEKDAPSSEPR